jgi:hypothetical protein
LILRYGEIEDYLPENFRDVGGIIKLLEDVSWLEKLIWGEKLEDLARVTVAAFNLSGKAKRRVDAYLRWRRKHRVK